MNLEWLNAAPDPEARSLRSRCCGSTRWVEGMLARRPFTNVDSLYGAATAVEATLDRADWLEAFAAHPRIGDVEGLKKKFAATAHWNEAEQAGVAGAAEDVLRDLARDNLAYEQRFGHI